MENDTRIPEGIDDPPQFLLWDLNEVGPIMLGLVVGMITANAMLFTLIGLSVTYTYRRFRRRTADGYFIHMLYWLGMPMKKARTLPNSFIRRFIP